MPDSDVDSNTWPGGGRRCIVPEEHGQGPKYFVNIDDVDHPWDRDTITVPEIRSLGGIPSGTEILEVNLETNEERTLAEDEIVPLKPGHGFGKKVRFRRG